jgi:hypothetical protein
VISRASLRLSADTVILALGLNVWLALVVLPAAFVGTFTRGPAFWLLAPLPVVPLLVGLVRRSPRWLLLGYPATLLVPAAVDARALEENAQSPILFALLIVNLCAFLFGAAYLTGLEGGAPVNPGQMRRLAAAERVAPRWRRRQRVYFALATLSGVFPIVLVYELDFSPTTRGFLAKLYPGRVPELLAALGVGVLVLWGVLYWIAFLGPLWHHRTGDRALVRRLDQLREEAKSSAPRLVFYLSVLIALGFMCVLLWVRLHP